MNSKLKLEGLRVLNTRPLGQNTSLSQAVQKAGGVSVDLPALTIEAILNWEQHMPDISTIHQAVFVSANAVHFYFSALKRQGVLWPKVIKTIAIGHASASALYQSGIQDVQTPAVADSEHLLRLDSLQQVQGQNILLIKGKGGRIEITNTLQARGAHLVALEVYCRKKPFYPTSHLRALWQNDAVDIILFTSEQAMYNLFDLFGEEARPWLCNKPCLVISERLAKIAANLGLREVFISHYDKILNSLHDYKQGLPYGNKQ